MPFSLRLAERKALLIVIDLVIVTCTTLLALWIMAARASWPFDRAYLLDQLGWFFFLPSLWLLSAFLTGLYDPPKVNYLAATALALFRTVSLIILVYMVIYFLFATPGSLPRGVVGYQGATSFFLMACWRALYGWLVQRLVFARPVIIVGAGWAGQTISQSIQQYAKAYYQLIGFVDDDPSKQQSRLTQFDPPLQVLGTSQDLLRLVRERGVPEIILAITRELSTDLFKALMDCKEQGVQITLMSTLYEQLTGQVPIEHIGDNWTIALPLDSAEAGGFYPIAKRAFDFLGALVGLVLFSLLLPGIALAIRLDSPGPIFYAHTRVGKGRKLFRLFKLRTMVADAEPEGHAVRAQANDPRVTRVGRLLRKMRLDEMPQLINVLKGEMSAVGPRPERPEHLAELDKVIPFHRLRNAVKPGMAGWAVVNYDYIESVDDAKVRLQYDLYYLKHQSLWLDLLILLRTMGHMLALKGR